MPYTYLSSLHCYKLSILFQAQYFLFVSSQHILSKDDFLLVMNGKDNIFLLLILRIREGRTHVLHNEIRIEPFRGNSVQACLSEVAADRDRSKSRHVQLGLLIYQTHLAHHTFQGVKCTSPTGWSDSHLSIAVNKYWLLRRTAFQSNVHYSGKQHSGYQI